MGAATNANVFELLGRAGEERDARALAKKLPPTVTPAANTTATPSRPGRGGNKKAAAAARWVGVSAAG